MQLGSWVTVLLPGMSLYEVGADQSELCLFVMFHHVSSCLCGCMQMHVHALHNAHAYACACACNAALCGILCCAALKLPD